MHHFEYKSHDFYHNFHPFLITIAIVLYYLSLSLSLCAQSLPAVLTVTVFIK